MMKDDTTRNINKDELDTMSRERLYSLIFGLQQDSRMHKSFYEEEKKNYKELLIDFKEINKERKQYKKELDNSI